jgi:uncharacterized phage infection (PIP) family protein YhgE
MLKKHNLSLEERERLAYVEGDTCTAGLLGDLIDTNSEGADVSDELEDTKKKLSERNAELADALEVMAKKDTELASALGALKTAKVLLGEITCKLHSVRLTLTRGNHENDQD